MTPVDTEATARLAEQLRQSAGDTPGDFCFASIGLSGSIEHFTVPNSPDAPAYIVTRLSDIGPENNIYFCAALFSPGSISNNRGREEANVVGVLAAVSDFDGKHDPATRNERLPFAPSAEVETSSGNFQSHFWFDTPQPPADAKVVLQALASSAGADKCKSVEHLWRVPGTLNYPTAGKIKAGRSPKPFLARWSITPQSWDVYSLADLRDGIQKKYPKAFEGTERGLPSAVSGARVDASKLQEALGYLDPNLIYNEGWRDIVAGIGAANCPEARDIAHDWSEGKLDRQKRYENAHPSRYRGPEPVDQVLDSMPAKEGGVGVGTIEHLAHEAGWTGTLAPRAPASETFKDFLDKHASGEEAPDTTSEDRSIPTSEDELAIQYVQVRHQNVKFIPELGEWAMLERGRWRKKAKEEIWEDMAPLARGQAAQAPTISAARKLVSRSHLSSSEALMRGKRKAIVNLEYWDSDPMLLNTPDGAYELPSGEIHVTEQAPYCLKSTATAPVPKGTDLHLACPSWLKFMEEITAGDRDYQAFLQRFIGYSLTGLTVEHAMIFAHGEGGNGKGVFFNTLNKTFGDYAQMAPLGMFEASLHERHTTEMARLHGARFVTAQETKKEARWDEVKIKAITGGDKITARWLFQKPFEFTPQCKLAIAGQHLPTLSRVDHAIKRRLLIVPFKVIFSNPDLDLPEKLWRERAGILRWAMDGTAEWKKLGLSPPAVVQEATQQYFSEQDHLGNWIAARCIVGPDGWAATKDLHDDYCLHIQQNGGVADGEKTFGQNLEARGFARQINKARTMRGFAGIALKPAKDHFAENLPDLEEGEF